MFYMNVTNDFMVFTDVNTCYSSFQHGFKGLRLYPFSTFQHLNHILHLFYLFSHAQLIEGKGLEPCWIKEYQTLTHVNYHVGPCGVMKDHEG